jgi:hypothetical protein
MNGPIEVIDGKTDIARSRSAWVAQAKLFRADRPEHLSTQVSHLSSRAVKMALLRG